MYQSWGKNITLCEAHKTALLDRCISRKVLAGSPQVEAEREVGGNFFLAYTMIEGGECDDCKEEAKRD